MLTWIGHLRRSWGQLVGPEATGLNTTVSVASCAVGMFGGAWAARRRGAGPWLTAFVALLATDLAGGAYVNNTRACARWYERPGQRPKQHLAFAAAHLHPFALAYADRCVGQRRDAVRWSLAHYTYMMVSTATIQSHPERRRSVGVILTAGGLALERVMGPSQVAPWFAWTFYPKLLMGHAAASLWTDTDLDS